MKPLFVCPNCKKENPDINWEHTCVDTWDYLEHFDGSPFYALKYNEVIDGKPYSCGSCRKEFPKEMQREIGQILEGARL